MAYLILFALLCLMGFALTIYDRKGLPPVKEIPGWALCIAIAAAFVTVLLAGIYAILSAMFGA